MLAWYKAAARERTSTRAVARFAPLVGAAPAAVVVRDLGKTALGRLRPPHAHGELPLAADPAAARAACDYVVVHELAHLHEPNHGPRFWRRVEDVLPDCKERRKRLTRRGDQLAF